MPSAISSPPPIKEGWTVVQPDPSDSDSVGLVSQNPLRTSWIPAVHPFLLVWSLGAGFLALRWFTGLARLCRLRRAATPTEATDVWRTEIAVPVTYGRTILMPLEAAVWPEARVRAAILHERAHIRRKDWVWQNIAALFAAVHWFNPLAWLLARLLRDTAETAADDAVLAQGVRPSDYARELLAVASGAGPTGPALAMARRGGVKDRVAAILNDRDRNGPSRRLAGALLSLLAIAGLAAAGVTTDHAQKESLPVTREEPVLVAGSPLRLLGIWEIGPRPARSWTADGGPASKELAAISDRMDDFEPKPDANKRNIKFVFDLPLVSPDSPGIVLRETSILDGLSANVQRGYKNQKGIAYTFLCEVAKDSPDRTDVRLGIADGKWHTIPVPKDRYLVRLTPKYHSGSLDGRKEVEVDAQIPNTIPKGQYRLAAFDAKGRRLEESGDLTTNDDRAAAGFYAPRGIARVVFEARPYRDVVFRDVPLRPVDRPAPAARLLGVVDRTGNRWDALGNPLPKDAAPARDMAEAGYPTEPGVRQVRLDFSLASAPVGTSTAFSVPPPVETRVSGADPKT
ncbi:M56 family metallopeptidase, partial [bacterium]